MRILSLALLFPAATKAFRQHLTNSPRSRRSIASASCSSSSPSHSHSALNSSSSSSLGEDIQSTTTAATMDSDSKKYRLLDGENSTGGIGKLADDYDVFLLDMWGVMHDGIKPYEGVPEVVRELRAAGKKLIILSNSSKRRSNSVEMLGKLGFSPEDDFSEIITSGEVAHHLLRYLSRADGGGDEKSSWVPREIPEAFSALRDANKEGLLSAYCFGSGDGDEDYLESCGWNLAESIETADLIVARGTFVVLSATDCADKKRDEEAYWAAYKDVLERASRLPNPPPMVVCNPDKVRPDADKSPMPGTIGVAYQELLEANRDDAMENDDRILSLGKPFSGVYDIALSSIIGSDDRSRVVMVGDALETDVTGATAAGIDSIWVVNDGIHNQEIDDAASTLEGGCEVVLEGFNARSEGTYARGLQVSPTVVIPHLRW
mmetsp:Transcript_26716/g.73501  ORF Transcript_26716/g.73501 Transcript_26716/m.73501 type:complete len:433 (+) Transcript_26716:277-1575(+)